MKKNLLIVGVLVVAGVLIWSLSDKEQETNVTTDQELQNTTVVLKTSQGDIEIELLAQQAPKTVTNFLTLARAGFYDGTMFHRVIKGFMIQGGDPLTKEQPTNWALHGQGGPDYRFDDELNDVELVKGVVAMANAGKTPDGKGTNGSQFFIITAPVVDWLNQPGRGYHTPFGRVVKGLDVVTKIENVKTNENDHPLEDVIIQSIVEAEGEPAPSGQ